VWAAVSGLALALGPVIGGTIVGVWDWRGIFWFNLAFGAAALVIGAVVLPENSDPDAHRVDTAGTLIGAAALATLVFAIIDSETAGFGSPAVLALLCVSAVAVVAFVWQERRAAHPLLDLRLLRMPRFTTANLAAFCVYFATFAIFFFTALYLEEVVGYSGYRIALVFLPMTVLMIATALLAGRWTDRSGPRWSITAGCLLFGAGLILTDGFLSPHPAYGPLMAALALAGAGIGTTVVPITTSVLDAVPPEHSGMAASATSTSREIGAVTGVAVLGALVNAQLSSHLTGQLRHLGVPASFQGIVINAVETGGVPSSGNTAGAGGAAGAGQEALVQEVINAAYSAFHSGLQAALYLSAGLVIAAGVLAALTLKHQ
jgi:predicted MFS family arabinose efflux permease